jgi:hypothetical protein
MQLAVRILAGCHSLLFKTPAVIGVALSRRAGKVLAERLIIL